MAREWKYDTRWLGFAVMFRWFWTRTPVRRVEIILWRGLAILIGAPVALLMLEAIYYRHFAHVTLP